MDYNLNVVLFWGKTVTMVLGGLYQDTYVGLLQEYPRKQKLWRIWICLEESVYKYMALLILACSNSSRMPLK